MSIAPIEIPDELEDGDAREPSEPRAAPFAMIGESVSFLPTFYPETIRVRRQRNLDRTQNFCSGEDVTDNGSKNPEIHLTGRMVGSEKDDFEDVLDVDGTFEMTSPAKSAEVRVIEGEFEGPVGWDPNASAYHFQYTIDVVTTGAGLRDAASGNGIISDGEDELPFSARGTTQ
jgi:hypothetical protein